MNARSENCWTACLVTGNNGWKVGIRDRTPKQGSRAEKESKGSAVHAGVVVRTEKGHRDNISWA